MQEFDTIIVGAGSAGSVLAARLSEDGARSVLLLEAGPKDTDPAVHMPVGYGALINNPKLNWRFNTEAEPTAGGRRIALPRGKLLGGSSSINGLIYIRGHPEDFNQWSNLGALGWGWSDLAPYFLRSERNVLKGPLHGEDGPLAVSNLLHDNPTNEAMIAAFEYLGAPRVADFNTLDQEGVGPYQITTSNGRRCSAARAYLYPARTRRNLAVETGAMVRRVLFEGRRASGVEYERGGQTIRVGARSEVILAAGAYQSPQILQLSGIGPGALLQSLGLPALADRADVGANLQDHYMAPLSWAARPGVYSYNHELKGLRMAWNIARYYATRRGPMTIPAGQIGVFMKSDPALDRPDLQYHCLAITGDLEAANRGEKASMHDLPGLTIGGAQLRPLSRGWVRAATPDARDHPRIQHNYLSESEDVRLAVAAMKIARRAAESPALAPLIDHEIYPGSQVQSDDDWASFARDMGTTMYHPVGTCRMGSDDAAVLDSHLRVKGVERLRVIDASVMPRLVSGNTNAATIAIAERASDLILGRTPLGG